MKMHPKSLSRDAIDAIGICRAKITLSSNAMMLETREVCINEE